MIRVIPDSEKGFEEDQEQTYCLLPLWLLFPGEVDRGPERFQVI